MALRRHKQEFDRHREALAVLVRPGAADDGPLYEPITRHREAADQLGHEMQRLIDELHGMGIEVKGIDQGLVDFPAERDGRTIYLCWMLDEPDIAYWHDLDTGFRGRQPL